MITFVMDWLTSLPANIEYTMNHMSVIQWAVVSATVVVLGFLALKSQSN
jgi:hypothetical protein